MLHFQLSCGLTEHILIEERLCFMPQDVVHALVAAAGNLWVVGADAHFTQRRPARRGPTLSMKGLLRAIVTNYTDLRFFAAPTAGGQRRYSVCLALDCSTSMQGSSFC
jgi:formate-dependent phosphoribosylglycinamide formyltransferase (GAR transformylase)